jgi:hypothetical protein
MSVLNNLLTEIKGIQDTLVISVNGNVVNNVVRKLPKAEETVDLAYQVTVSGEELVDQLKRIGFSSRWQVIYAISLTLITPTERDMVYNLADGAQWRETTRAFYETQTPLEAPPVKRVEFASSPFLRRNELAQGYDYNQLTLRITTYEDRS